MSHIVILLTILFCALQVCAVSVAVTQDHATRPVIVSRHCLLTRMVDSWYQPKVCHCLSADKQRTSDAIRLTDIAWQCRLHTHTHPHHMAHQLLADNFSWQNYFKMTTDIVCRQWRAMWHGPYSLNHSLLAVQQLSMFLCADLCLMSIHMCVCDYIHTLGGFQQRCLKVK